MGSLLLLLGSLAFYTFTHLSIEDGVSGTHVFSICQTQDGVVWWSTKNTVDRYNGRSVRNYFLDEDAPYNYFGGRTVGLVLSDDGRQDLYAFDNKGRIYRYSQLTDSFSVVADMAERLGSGPVIQNHVYVNADGIWSALDKGTFLIREGALRPVLDKRATNYILPCDGALLLCTDSGVFKVDDGLSQASFFYPCKAVTGYWDQERGHIWLGAFTTGVTVLDRTGALLGEVGGIPSNPVRSIIAQDPETVLVGVDGFGVYAVPASLHPATASLLFHANKGEKGVLHGNGVYALLKDRWGDLFIGTYSGGVDIARPRGDFAQVFDDNPNNHVNCVASVPGKGLLLGTDDGVCILKEGKWTHLARGYVVLDICEDGEDLLLATFGNGVLKLDKHLRLQELYSVSGGQIRGDHVYSLFKSADGHLWMGCLSGDLVERTESGFRYYPVQNVQDIVQLPDGRIAVATANGIHLVTSGSPVPEELVYAPGGMDVNRYAESLTLDGNRLWIATDGGGVYILELESGACRQLTRNDGLTGNSVNSIVKGSDGSFWVFAEDGLSRVDPEGRVTPMNHIWILNRNYTRGASLLLPDGRLLAGSADGAVLIDPGKVEDPFYDAGIHLTGASFNARNPRERADKMARLLGEKPELKLRFRDNTFELDFESVNLRYQQDISYQYRLDGGKWSRPSGEGHFRFSELETGSHLLEVRSISREGQLQLDSMSLPITIAQPLWNTWWMWLIYFLVLSGAFVGAWRVYQLHSKYMRLVLTGPAVQVDDTQEGKGEEKSSGNKEFVDKVTRTVVEHLSQPEFSIDDLCREMGLSRTYLYMRLKAFTGESPQDFIRIIRMERAAVLLRAGQAVNQVAEAVGFDNPKYFSTVFKKYFDISPSKYK